MSDLTAWAQLVLVALAAGLGGVARVAVDDAISRVTSRLGVGIAVVNVIGSAAVGFVGASGIGGYFGNPIAMVALGGFTTFSTAMVDVITTARQRSWLAAVGLAVGTLALCWLIFVGGAWLGATYAAPHYTPALPR